MSPPASSANLDEWLSWLESLDPTEIELGLERVSAVLQRLELGLDCRTIHVAGTNGKGSTVAMLEALLRAAGQSVGAYTSPHILHYNERVRVNGEVASDQSMVRAFTRVEAARGATHLTYFEIGTLAALCIFDEAGVDNMLLEVGLGGRLDAVNAVHPDAGIITNIALDHCDWLGDNVEDIGAEKAGIMRGGKPFVFGAREMPESVAAHAAEIDAHLYQLGKEYDYTRHDDGRWSYQSVSLELPQLALLPLAGDFQMQNAAAVFLLLETLQEFAMLEVDAINAAFAGLHLPGRFERLQRDREWIIDVAHNAAAAAALASALRSEGRQGLSCVIGVLDDKDVAAIVAELSPFVDEWLAVTAAGSRAVPANELARIVANLTGKACQICESVDAACASLDSSQGAGILATGSFMTVAPVISWLRENTR